MPLEPRIWSETTTVSEQGSLVVGGMDVRELAQQFGTPLFVLDETDLISNISSYNTTISNSITISGTGTELDPYIRTSNLSLSVVQNMSNNITTIDTTMATKRHGDEENYTLSRQMADEFNTLRQFNSIGATANNLIQNYIGSDKLLTRLNS